MYINTNNVKQEFDLESMIDQTDYFFDELEVDNVLLNDFESEKKALQDLRH